MSLIYDPSANNKPGKADALYLDNAGFKQEQNNINNHEGTLKLDISALSAQEEISGTECVGLLLKHWREVAEAGDAFRNFGLNSLDPMMGKIQKSIINADVENAKAIGVSSTIPAQGKAISLLPPISAPSAQFFFGTDGKGDTEEFPFDDKGLYGADQMELGAGTDWWITIFGEDDQVYNLVRSYDDYKDFSDSDVHDFLKEITNHGCTFAAMANVIMLYFQGKAREFKEKFGFDMIDPKTGDLNFKMLIVYLFINLGYLVALGETSGLEGLGNAYQFSAANYNKEFNQNAQDYSDIVHGLEKIEEEAWKTGNTELKLKGLHTSDELMANRLAYISRKKGMNLRITKGKDKMDVQTVRNAIADGQIVLLSAKKFELENAKGDVVYSSGEDSGNGPDSVGHEMTITGVTDDGRYIVSSWGKKYYFNPNSQNVNQLTLGYYFVDFKTDPRQVPENEAKIYDEYGTYGGDAAALRDKYTTDELINVMKDSTGYSFYKEEDVAKAASRFKKLGGPYIAMANTAFNAYQGRQKEFEEKFKIPMIGPNGDLNIELLAFIIFMKTDTFVYFDEKDGLECCADYIKDYYKKNPEDYEFLHHKGLYDEFGTLSSEMEKELQEVSLSEAKRHKEIVEKNGGNKMALPSGFDSIGPFTIPNRYSYFCKENTINASIREIPNRNDVSWLDPNDIKKALEDGYEVVGILDDALYEDVNGNRDLEDINVRMNNTVTITGVIGIGDRFRYEVSSYGKKFQILDIDLKKAYTIKYDVDKLPNKNK